MSTKSDQQAFKSGKYVRDELSITICSKTAAQTQQKNHNVAHGYTKSLKDTQVIRVAPGGSAKPDDTKDPKGKDIWPTGLPSEEVVHTG